MILERRLVEILTSPPNISEFSRILNKEFDVSEFKHCCNEFPIIVKNSYHFIDIFGIDFNNFYFIEVKTREKDLKQAKNQCKINENAYIKNGLFNKKEINLYYKRLRKLFSIKEPKNPKFIPLILNESIIEKKYGISFNKLLDKHYKFLLEGIIKKYPNLKKIIENHHTEQNFPYLPLHDKSSNQTNIRFYEIYKKSRTQIKISRPIEDFPQSYKLKITDSEAFKFLSNNSGKFTIHYFLDGRNRPSFFFEIGEDQFLNLTHYSRRSFIIGPIFNTFVAYDYGNGNKPLLYSAILIDKGNYKSIKMKNNQIMLKLDGESNKITLNLEFSSRLKGILSVNEKASKNLLDFSS
ncbi:MAG: hypothetical protein ACTSVV_13430 [Promethearchaeota archaeon]